MNVKRRAILAVSRSSRPLFCLSIAMLLLVSTAIVAGPADAAPSGFYTWAKWRLGHAPFTCQAGVPWVRPNVPLRVPASWWKRLERYEPAPCDRPTGEPEQPVPTEPPVEVEPVAEPTLTAREQALRNAVNAVRQRHGLQPIAVASSLQRAARDHTADIVRFGYLGHDWHNGAPLGAWVDRYTACTAGEIIAWRTPQQSANSAVQQWLNSPSHRAALLSRNWAIMGVELGRRHATVVFGERC